VRLVAAMQLSASYLQGVLQHTLVPDKLVPETNSHAGDEPNIG
jgi:hypothetical protein